ncbi:hypothetical protein LOZ12_006246 [Ophidiomyces ophidiicola]|nr:hypothetical protein LOZ62_006142 [Ophidiomyces ophidiicola]KAI2031983.1 hypothetical protein LOZ47_005938 [Ophidiomyces ophidiicola]KAI2045193.1 hypothetical protein LOZ38_006005 [Ophidiomyces ophidiicola]KAI2067743.1 hypothetical protein LOZ39_006043 [Ophidiomyces ophidiicola]KAI2069397.1 hypothetical protein LOZ37_005295 [Ophidiomyces ophidiicola]
MSRSATDATRFTATAPHAYSKPGPSLKWPGAKLKNAQNTPSPVGGGSSSSSSNNNGTHQETPKEKVERLRAEARAARIANSSSTVDRVISRGRVWVDRLHRITVFSLIAASGVAGLLTIYSVTSLISHNRRQKALWIDRELQRLLDARKAYVAGNATAEQLALLENEKAGEEEKRRKEELKQQNPYYKAKNWLFGGLKRDDDSAMTESLERGPPKVLKAINAKAAADAAVANPTSQEVPGDSALNAVQESANDSKKSWKSWITGR